LWHFESTHRDFGYARVINKKIEKSRLLGLKGVSSPIVDDNFRIAKSIVLFVIGCILFY
jgi:hypothetical protein